MTAESSASAACWRARSQGTNATAQCHEYRRTAPFCADEKPSASSESARKCTFSSARQIVFAESSEHAARLLVVVAAHVQERKGWALLHKCLCSVGLYHPYAFTLLADSGSPSAYSQRLRSLANRTVLHCRSETSAWSFGILHQATGLVRVSGIAHSDSDVRHCRHLATDRV
eukprot:1713390-Prymnesium_polylepis.1